MNDFAIGLDCRFGQWTPPTFPVGAIVDYLNDLLAFTLEIMGCPFQGLQAGPLTDRLAARGPREARGPYLITGGIGADLSVCTHDARSNIMNMSTFSCGVSGAALHSVG